MSLSIGLGLAAGCGSASSPENSSSALSLEPSESSVASTDLSSSPEVTDDSVSATPSPSLVPPVGEWDVRVTASGGGGLIDSVGTADLELLDGIGPDDPWLRFGLGLNYCCGEANSVVFGPDQWSFEIGDEGQLRIDGPLC